MENALSDNGGQRPPVTASDRHSPPMADSDGQAPADDSKRGEFHNLTVLDVVRLFEEAGVPRSQRSVVRWCKPNAQDEKRLDSFLDPVSRKYFITPESAKQVIEEEKSKQQTDRVFNPPDENLILSPLPEDGRPDNDQGGAVERQNLKRKIKELERSLQSSDIAIEVKDIYAAKLIEDNKNLINELMLKSEKIGRLETQLKQLEPPKADYKESVITIDEESPPNA